MLILQTDTLRVRVRRVKLAAKVTSLRGPFAPLLQPHREPRARTNNQCRDSKANVHPLRQLRRLEVRDAL
jgi:hypothetical protein